ncbi:hypothetical protein C8J57DRAFT_1235895 [Mycena rebaudengoi]|nr:hypothetical protein C8J57DRAFT_1235895 [Mycena rebaudengoi]
MSVRTLGTLRTWNGYCQGCDNIGSLAIAEEPKSLALGIITLESDRMHLTRKAFGDVTLRHEALAVDDLRKAKDNHSFPITSSPTLGVHVWSWCGGGGGGGQAEYASVREELDSPPRKKSPVSTSPQKQHNFDIKRRPSLIRFLLYALIK